MMKISYMTTFVITINRDVVLKTAVLVSRPEFCGLGLGLGTCGFGLGLGLEELVSAVFKTDQ